MCYHSSPCEGDISKDQARRIRALKAVSDSGPSLFLSPHISDNPAEAPLCLRSGSTGLSKKKAKVVKIFLRPS